MNKLKPRDPYSINRIKELYENPINELSRREEDEPIIFGFIHLEKAILFLFLALFLATLITILFAE